jgi:hypothetical protein
MIQLNVIIFLEEKKQKENVNLIKRKITLDDHIKIPEKISIENIFKCTVLPNIHYIFLLIWWIINIYSFNDVVKCK